MKGTYEKILRAALDEIEAVGLGATTKRIAQRSGTSELTLFRHFGTKQQLFIAALSQVVGDAATLNLQPSGTIQTDLGTIATQYVQLADSHPGVLVHVLTATDKELTRTIVLPLQRKIAENLLHLMQFYKEQGALDTGISDEDLVREFMGPLLARAILHRSLERRPFDANEYVRRFLSGRTEHTS